MARNERLTSKEAIDPALSAAGWRSLALLRITPREVSLTGDTLSDGMLSYTVN